MASSSIKHTTLMLIVMVVFGVTLVGMNMFYLPSLGLLSSEQTSQYKAALEEFTGGYYNSYTGPAKSTTNIRGRKEHIKHTYLDGHVRSDGKIQHAPFKVPPHAQNINETDADAEGTPTPTEENADGGDKDQKTGKDDDKSGQTHNGGDETHHEPSASSDDEESTLVPKIAGLKCDRYGGPSEEIAAEMVYWRDIPRDAKFHSPFHDPDSKDKKYLTFEPDEGGFNNIRMSMETATALAHAMGRILVLPPEQRMYLLGNDHRHENNKFTFHKFFPFEAIAQEHEAVEVISMEEFLQTEVMTGKLKDPQNGKPVFPPGNKTSFEGNYHGNKDTRQFWDWLRTATTASKWDFSQCTAVFPSKPGKEAAAKMRAIYEGIDKEKQNHGTWQRYHTRPQSVSAPTEKRLQEMLSFRKDICLYDETFQDAKVMHFMGNNDSGARLLVHFYAFLFFEDWTQDLWTKRYVRDHLRYIDAIQCGAASIVHAMRQKAKENGNPDGRYDSMHIRRGDFQYKHTRIPAEEIYSNIKDVFAENATLFIATDEKDKAFFDPLRKHYKLYFLDDFIHLLPEEFNKNYYGMLDQRIASRGDIFAGSYLSTFTGYINRMRGYHTQKDKAPGYLEGELQSYFYVPLENKDEMRDYMPLRGPLWGREFPVGWRDIDHDLEEAHIVAR